MTEMNVDIEGSAQATASDTPQSQFINLGKEVRGGTDNSVSTTKYTLLTFLPIALAVQFRRFGNIYFLFVCVLMFIGGTFPDLFPSTTSWVSMAVPLALIHTLSLFIQGTADLKRKHTDIKVNYHPCMVLHRTEDVKPHTPRVKDFMDGHDTNVRLVTKLSPQRANRSVSADGTHADIACTVTK